MLKNKVIKLISLFFMGGIITICSLQIIENKRFDVVVSLDNINYIDNMKAAYPDSILLQNEKLLFSYNDSTTILSFIYNNRNFSLGNFHNTFDIPPDVDIKSTDTLIYIIVMNRFYDLGYGWDIISVFSFNKYNLHIYPLVETEDIGMHDTSFGTLSNIQYYDYKIDTEKQELIINEYSPYMPLNNKNQKYTTTTHQYPFTTN